MDDQHALAAFAALSQETRLRIVRRLVVAGPEGMAAGAIADALGLSPSSLSFHLKELDRAGLIGQKRESRSIIYSASYDGLASLVRFLMDDCCSGHPDICSPTATPATCCTPSASENLQ